MQNTYYNIPVIVVFINLFSNTCESNGYQPRSNPMASIESWSYFTLILREPFCFSNVKDYAHAYALF